MADSLNHDAASPTPITPAKSSSSSEVPIKRLYHSTPLYRKLAGNPNLKKSLLHVFMDPALKEELFQSQLLDVPGLVEHLFPDTLFPIPFDLLKAGIVQDSHQWSIKFNRWQNYLDIASTESPVSGTSTIPPGTGERALATFLNKLSSALVRVCKKHNKSFKPQSKREWASESNKPMRGGPNARRKPDINLVEKGQEATWASTLVTVELKSKAATSEVTKALVQLTNSAYMVFATQDERRFQIGVSFCHADVRLYIFDRSGVIGSQKFHLKDNPELLIRLVAGLVLTDVDAIGLDSSIRHIDDDTRSITVADHEYELIDTLFISDSIRGRGTVCWQARRDGVDYVIKNTWTDTSRRQTEADILRSAGNVEGIAHIVEEEVVQYNGTDDSTATIRNIIAGLDAYQHKEWYDRLEIRVHRRLVTTPLAEGLTHFRSKKELLLVLIDAIEAHRRLIDKHILHRDISMANIMIYRPQTSPNKASVSEKHIDTDDISTEEDSDFLSSTKDPHPSNQSVKGILIDLDYAMVTHDVDGNILEREHVATGHRTGTLPFMAVQILRGLPDGQEQEAHHDLESFFYVFLWVCLQYAGPGNTERHDYDIEKNDTIKNWIAGSNFQKIGNQKYMHMTSREEAFHINVTSEVSLYFQDLVPCIEELRQKLFPMDCRIPTHQDIIDILRKPLAWLPHNDNWSRENDPKGYGPPKRKLDDIDEGDEEQQEDCSPSKVKRARTVPSRNVADVEALVPSQRSRRSTRLRSLLPRPKH